MRQQQRTTIASFRRQRSRKRQRQNRQSSNNNRFAILSEDNSDDPTEIEITDKDDEPNSKKKLRFNKDSPIKQKSRLQRNKTNAAR